MIRHLRLVNPDDTGRNVLYDAVVDTGADFSVCPTPIIGPLLLNLTRSAPPVRLPTGEFIVGWELQVEHEDEGIDVPAVYVYPPEPLGLPRDQLILGRDVINEWHMSLRPTDGALGVFEIFPQDDDPPGPFFSPPNLLST